MNLKIIKILKNESLLKKIIDNAFKILKIEEDEISAKQLQEFWEYFEKNTEIGLPFNEVENILQDPRLNKAVLLEILSYDLLLFYIKLFYKELNTDGKGLGFNEVCKFFEKLNKDCGSPIYQEEIIQKLIIEFDEDEDEKLSWIEFQGLFKQIMKTL